MQKGTIEASNNMGETDERGFIGTDQPPDVH